MKAIVVAISLLFCGCAVQYKEVYKAIRCDIDMPEKPKKNNDRVEMLREVLIYSNLLEERLKACRGEQNEN